MTSNKIAFIWEKYSILNQYTSIGPHITIGAGSKVGQRGAGVCFGHIIHILDKNSAHNGRYDIKL